jgi:hypothetical protein
MLLLETAGDHGALIQDVDADKSIEIEMLIIHLSFFKILKIRFLRRYSIT